MQAKPAAALLREMRARQGKSLRAAAGDLGVTAGYLSRVERGEKAASSTLTRRAASYYGLDPDLLGLAEGRIPADILTIFREHPEALDLLRARFGEK